MHFAIIIMDGTDLLFSKNKKVQQRIPKYIYEDETLEL